MDRLSVSDFPNFFHAVHGVQPFPWQTMLLEKVVHDGHWPDVIDLPTASGKTACIDIAVFLLAIKGSGANPSPARRRIFFVVDRRIVVDEAFDRAVKICEALREPNDRVVGSVANSLRQLSGGTPLAALRLRGGQARRGSTALASPLQPAIITSTVDQVGSRLLFRSYGTRAGTSPVYAALTAFDSLLILDEAHCAKPFSETVGRVAQYLRRGPLETPPISFVRMSATMGTPGDSTVFPADRERADALDDPELRRRMGATKFADLVSLANGGNAAVIAAAVGQASEAIKKGNRRVAVMLNRVALATEVSRRLAEKLGGNAEVALLTGRMRPFDRDGLMNRYSPILRSQNPEEPNLPVVVVTTQCLEVGADFSFDHLVTQCAAFDALVQRFGRLNRLGNLSEASAVVIGVDDGSSKSEDPIYGSALAATWKLLVACSGSSADGRIDISPGAIHKLIRGVGEKILAGITTPSLTAPPLLPVHLDILCQTSPRPAPDVDVPAFLHGSGRGDAEVRVAFRQDINSGIRPASSGVLRDYFDRCPVSAAECFAVPLRRFASFMRGAVGGAAPDEADVEGYPAGTGVARDDPNNLITFARFRDGEWEGVRGDAPDAAAPGDLMVLPANEIPPAIGTLPPGAEVDVAEAAAASAGGGRRSHLFLRLSPIHIEALGLPTGEGPLSEWIGDAAVQRDEGPDSAALADILANVAWPDGDAIGRLRRACKEGRPPQLFPNPLNSTEDHQDYIAVWPGRIELDAAGGSVDSESEGAAEVLLQQHLEDVRVAALRFAALLPAGIRGAVGAAAGLHDIGKLEPRFQQFLGAKDAPLAKSRHRARWRGFRHEMLSMEAARDALAAHLPADDPGIDLALHLIAAHHGYARPFAPYQAESTDTAINTRDFEPPVVWAASDSADYLPAHHIGSGVAERFWRLTRAYGWWGLALIEATVRLADWQASGDHHEQVPEKGGEQ